MLVCIVFLRRPESVSSATRCDCEYSFLSHSPIFCLSFDIWHSRCPVAVPFFPLPLPVSLCFLVLLFILLFLVFINFYSVIPPMASCWCYVCVCARALVGFNFSASTWLVRSQAAKTTNYMMRDTESPLIVESATPPSFIHSVQVEKYTQNEKRNPRNFGRNAKNENAANANEVQTQRRRSTYERAERRVFALWVTREGKQLLLYK